MRIIEDAAEAHGAEYQGQKCGGLGDISCFSFYANKIITTGEGGMLLTDSVDYADRARSLRNLCFRPEQRFYHTELGHNFRLTNLQAAIGLAQVERMDNALALKRKMAAAYYEGLAGVPGITLPVEEPWAKNVYWMYGIVLDESLGFDASEFAKRLKKRGVDTRPFFLPMHQQPVFHRMGFFQQGESYPVAERLGKYGLYLPSGLSLTDSQNARVCDVVRSELIS